MNLKLAEPEKRIEGPYFTVDYEEYKPDTYRVVKVDAGTHGETFFSGDFKKDINDALEKYPEPVLFSSTVHSYMRETGIQI